MFHIIWAAYRLPAKSYSNITRFNGALVFVLLLVKANKSCNVFPQFVFSRPRTMERAARLVKKELCHYTVR